MTTVKDAAAEPTAFAAFELSAPILKALEEGGYARPTPIQTQAIPNALAGRDVLGIAQTGTGKTAAFALPIIDYINRNQIVQRKCSCRALVLAPTRELVAQISDSFKMYGAYVALRTEAVFGGVPIKRQFRALERGAGVVVATPGRLLDLIEQKALSITDVEVLVLDEADQMMDMGFIHALRRIAKLLPPKRQTLFFSATMPKQIRSLADEFLTDPVQVSVAPQSTTAERVDQFVSFVKPSAKPPVLAHILAGPDVERALVFTRTKHGADKVVRLLKGAGLESEAIHGNKSQPQRRRALDAFKSGRCKILIATDIAARGLDIDGVSHVINFELPNVPEQYVHRIGRTARAGKAGTAISLVANDEKDYLRDIEKQIRQSITVIDAPDGLPRIEIERNAPISRSEPKESSGRRRPQRRRKPQSTNSEQTASSNRSRDGRKSQKRDGDGAKQSSDQRPRRRGNSGGDKGKPTGNSQRRPGDGRRQKSRGKPSAGAQKR